jgi:hypothetical protein
MLVTPFNERRHPATRRMAIGGYPEISIGGNHVTFVRIKRSRTWSSNHPNQPAMTPPRARALPRRPAPLMPSSPGTWLARSERRPLGVSTAARNGRSWHRCSEFKPLPLAASCIFCASEGDGAMGGGVETGVQTPYYILAIIFMLGGGVAAYVKGLQGSIGKMAHSAVFPL